MHFYHNPGSIAASGAWVDVRQTVGQVHNTRRAALIRSSYSGQYIYIWGKNFFSPHRFYREKGRVCEFMTGENGFHLAAGRRVAWQCQTHAPPSPRSWEQLSQATYPEASTRVINVTV